MKKTFTPGPWEVFDVDGVIGVAKSCPPNMADVAHLTSSDGELFHKGRSREEVLATARLIANAPALWGLARTVANGGSLEQGRAAQILRAIRGEPGKDAWRDEPDAQAAGFTGQEQAKEMGETHTWRGPAANFINLPKVPHLPSDVAAALGAAYVALADQTTGAEAFTMVKAALGRYCNVID